MNVPEFVSGNCALVTGATGCVGSVLLEQLLRAGVARVYVLVREQPRVTAQQRLDKLLQLPLFSEVQNATTRVQAVSGDVTLSGLGLSAQDKQTLVNHVTLVFHCAAKVSFTSSLTSAVTANLIGSRNVMNLCLQISNLQGLVYVSTAYANCTRREVSERLYPPPCDPAHLITLVENDTARDHLLKKYLGGHPNTYTLSKQLAEHWLAENRGHVKVAIVRPSIVLGTWRSPFPGWQVVGTGAAAFMAGVAKGVFRSSIASPGKVADLIPADLVAESILAAAWKLVQPGSQDLAIYHVTSGVDNPLTWGQFTSHVVRAARELPCHEVAWYPGAKCRPQPWRHALVSQLCMLWPAYLLDLVETYTSASHNKHKTATLVSIQKRFIKGGSVVRFFSKQQWKFHGDNMAALRKNAGLENRLQDLEWSSYIEGCMLGVRQHFFKDPPSTLVQARSNMRKWRLVHHLSVAMLLLAMMYLVFIYVTSDPLTLTATTLVLAPLFLWL